ncbi:hypothetical protein ACFL5K_04935 [Gemmatimonadota bacterium]
MHLSKIKFLSAVLAMSFAFLCLLGTVNPAWAEEEEEEPEEIMYVEDINQDYKVDIADIIALMIKARNDPEDPVADYNGDGTCSIMDAIALLLNIKNGNLTVLEVPKYSAKGRVVLETGGGLAGVEIVSDGEGIYQKVVTDMDGSYRIGGLIDGTYEVKPILRNYYYTFEPEDFEVTIDGDSVVLDDIVAYPADFTLTGTILEDKDSVGLADVSVAVVGEDVDVTVTTDADGVYTIDHLLNAPYTVVPTLDGYTFSPLSLAITMLGDSTVQDIIATQVDTAPTLYMVSGKVTCSIGALSNVTVILSGDAEASTVSDGTGFFAFLVPDGEYTVSAVPIPELQFMSPSEYSPVTVDGADVTYLDFYGFGAGL